jgi:hypothetical protein
MFRLSPQPVSTHAQKGSDPHPGPHVRGRGDNNGQEKGWRWQVGLEEEREEDQGVDAERREIWPDLCMNSDRF